MASEASRRSVNRFVPVSAFGTTETSFDPVQLLVMANRMDGITREMTNILVRTARSATLVARDFSCSIVDAENNLFAAPEGLPVHVYGSGLLCEAMAELHPDREVGDAFLHNDPYLGNSHPADHTILVPVFFDGAHVFTTCVKAHLSDIGNAIPSTYVPKAVDVYAEGALIFPCVRIQRAYQDVDDIIRMCEKRIRVPEVWYGDYLAMLAAVRVGEERIKEFCAKFGLETVRRFTREWLDYSERLSVAAIRQLPAGRVKAQSTVDPFPGIPDGLPIKAAIEVDPDAGRVTVDLRDNPDCTPTGLNLSRSTAMNAAITGILVVLNSKRAARAELVPHNAGAFRRFTVLLRENCAVGIPIHPTSCSMATTTVASRTQGMIFSAFGRLIDGIGLAEPCCGQGPFMAVVSGYNRRRDEPYVFQLFSGTAGGPASAESDGWLSLLAAAAAGLMYIDETEVVEQKYPFVIFEKRARPDSEGAGRQRGAPGNICSYGPLWDPMEAHYTLDGMHNVPQGVQGGGPAKGSEAHLALRDGSLRQLRDVVGEQGLDVGERIVSLSDGGGGYGDPLTREPEAVLRDVTEGYVSIGRARDAYGVVISGDPTKVETLSIDEEATAMLRG